ncbi:MAG TPA: exonuclease domain-containing protein [Dermatophilaceae bacterium]|nr:exonuclease domain-containing protein [Dermatophilaceae bacterium]
MLRRFSPDGRRERAVSSAPAGPLRDYLSVPFPDLGTPATELPMLAVDVETTGLDPAKDRLLSVGFVPLQGLRIELSGAAHLVVRTHGGVGQSAVVHGLTDDVLADGEDLETIVPELLRALRGRVMLAHVADIEEGFLTAACQRLFGSPFHCLSLDTMQLQERVNGAAWNAAPTGSLRLPAARARFRLPRYRSHEALTDALACAELYLAQVALLSGGAPMTLKQLRR